MSDSASDRRYTVLCHSSEREKWLGLRREGVGGSDSPILCNVSSYGSWLSLALDKRGESGAFEGNEFTRAGNKLEPFIAEWALEEMAEEDEAAGRVKRHGAPYGFLIRSNDVEWLAATPDWLVSEDGVEVPFQIKNSMMASRWDDGVPPDVEVQIQHEMLVFGAAWGYVGCLLTGNRLRWARVEANAELQEQIIDASASFWSLLESGGEMPIDGSEHTRLALATMHPDDNGETVALDADMMEVARELDATKQERKITDAAIKIAENRLKAAIGDATYGTFPDGSGFSLKTTTRHDKPREAKDVTFRTLRRQMAK